MVDKKIESKKQTTYLPMDLSKVPALVRTASCPFIITIQWL
jgi:hypothetical protein